VIKTLTDFDQTINQALEDWHIPGAALAVVKGEQVLHSGGYGFRDVEQGLPITENTRFPIASMTKPFTVMGAALLVDEGLLGWDQPIRDAMPEFRLFDDYATQHATLRDLLSHRTGLPRHDSTWYGKEKTRQELFEGLRHLKPNAAFRSLWQYNNLMYETVGLLCAQLTGANTWEDFVQSRILDVLGMDATTPNFDQADDSRFTDIALPYRLKMGHSTPEKMPFFQNPLGPAGSMHSTLNDMVTWLKVHINGSPLISPYNLKQMHTPHMLMPASAQQEQMFNHNVFAYGMGWFVEPYQGVTLLHHGGNINGFSLMAGFVPQEQVAVVVLTNIDAKGLRTALLYEAIDRALGVDSSRSKNWSSVFLTANNKLVEAAMKAGKSSEQDRVASAPASHPLEAYAGSYGAPGYADIKIKWQEQQLLIWHLGEWFACNHYHYDVFEIDARERYDETIKISFTLDNQGTISLLHIPIEPAIGDMAFSRKPEVLEAELQAQLTGHYQYPLAGQEVLVSLENEVLSLALSGQAKQTLHCVNNNPAKLRFKFAGNSQTLVDFIADDKGYSQLLIKHPDASYDCPRKATAVRP
jgi:CubicO group peptidase (beta-lactamase class C family)